MTKNTYVTENDAIGYMRSIELEGLANKILFNWWTAHCVRIVDGENWQEVTCPWRAGMTYTFTYEEAREITSGI